MKLAALNNQKSETYCLAGAKSVFPSGLHVAFFIGGT